MLDELRSLAQTTKNLRKTLLILLLALTLLTACEPDTAIYITLDEKMPPSFSFSGPWWAVDFRVAEMPPKETYSREEPLVDVLMLRHCGKFQPLMVYSVRKIGLKSRMA